MIGIFDSGSGGLTVLRALRQRAPDADVVYFGDLANAPYGNKSREELGALTVLCIQKLMDEGATDIVSACNSVSVSIVLPTFKVLNLPRANIIEMVGPTVAGFRGKKGNILVAATKATVESGVYQDGFRTVGISTDSVALPELVALIESGAPRKMQRDMVIQALEPHRGKKYTHLVLGCTHYPLVRDVFEHALQKLEMQMELVDPAHFVAETAVKQFDTHGNGSTRMHISAESDTFRMYAQDVLENGMFEIILTDAYT